MNKFFIPIFCFSTFLFASLEVSVVTPKLYTDSLTSEVDGLVLAKKVSLTAQANGLVHFYINDNANVIKGEIIAKIVDDRRSKKLSILKEKLTLLENQVHFQKDRVKVAQDKYTMGVASKNDYLNEKITFEQFLESQKSLLLEYETLQIEEDKSIIKAQNNGFITKRSNEESFVSYGDSLGVLTLEDTQVKLFISPKYAANIQKAMQVTLQSSYGEVSAIVEDILGQTSSNLLEVIVTPTSPLPVNLQLKSKIVLQNFEALKIPKDAVVLVDNQAVVYLIENGVAHLKPIEILKDMTSYVLIKNTLPKKSKVALKNAYMLHDNLEVLVK